MENTWLVIANATTAYIYNIDKSNGELKDLPLAFQEHHAPVLVKTLDHPEGRMLAHEFMADKDGHSKSPGASHGKFSEHTTPHQIEGGNFAEQIAHFLHHEHDQNHFTHLIICAEPHFHGLINEKLAPHVEATVKHHIMKDYVPLQPQGLRKVIEELQKEK